MLLLFILNFTLPGVINQGDRIFYYDARSLALGGVASILKYGNNPACVGLIDEVSIFISGALINCNEKRGLRVYDSYGNNIGISTVSNNTLVNTDLAGSSIVLPVRDIKIGIRYSPLWDFNYYFRREYRDDFYQITKIAENRCNGNVYSLSPFVGFSYKSINIGVEENFIYGDRTEETKVIVPNASDTVTQHENRFSGNTTKFGIIIYPNVHFRLSYGYSLRYTIKDGEDDVRLQYADNHTFGFLYQPPGRVPTKFLCEINYEKWSEPVFIYKFGVEHTILGRCAMRYGFCVFPDYDQTAIWTTVLSVGFGVNTKRYHFDIGYGYGKRDYSSTNYNGLGVDENLKFDESTNNFLVSIGFTF